MRMKMVCDDRTLRDVANEFLALKKAQKVRERTLNDYRKYINKFIEQSENSLDVDVLKVEILDFFADIPKTSPARFNHPYDVDTLNASANASDVDVTKSLWIMAMCEILSEINMDVVYPIFRKIGFHFDWEVFAREHDLL